MLYVYEGCCGTTSTERRCRLATYLEDPTFACPNCGRALTQWLTAPRLLTNTKEFQAFKSPVDGSIIYSEASLREHNKRNNVVNIHEGYSEDTVKKFTQQDFQKPLDEERAKDLAIDLRESVQKLQEGYVPEVAPESEIIPEGGIAP